MIPLPTWMRRALFATAGMNILAAAAFLPAAEPLRALLGFPEAGHALYLLTVGMFILIFGLGYLWAAIAGRAERLFITLAAAGKLSFFGLLVGYWAAGTVPIRLPVLGTGDLIFAMLFLAWLFGVRGSADRRSGAEPALPVGAPASRARS